MRKTFPFAEQIFLNEFSDFECVTEFNLKWDSQSLTLKRLCWCGMLNTQSWWWFVFCCCQEPHAQTHTQTLYFLSFIVNAIIEKFFATDFNLLMWFFLSCWILSNGTQYHLPDFQNFQIKLFLFINVKLFPFNIKPWMFNVKILNERMNLIENENILNRCAF